MMRQTMTLLTAVAVVSIVRPLAHHNLPSKVKMLQHAGVNDPCRLARRLADGLTISVSSILVLATTYYFTFVHEVHGAERLNTVYE